jgi:ATP dependent DNA ligase domain
LFRIVPSTARRAGFASGGLPTAEDAFSHRFWRHFSCAAPIAVRLCPPAFWRIPSGGENREKQIGFVEPMLAVAVTKLPEGPAWAYELKFDGYRALGLKANGQVQLLSRNGKDFTKRFASIARALEFSLTRLSSKARSSSTARTVGPRSTSCKTIAASDPSCTSTPSTSWRFATGI